MKAALTQAWLARGPLAWALRPVSLIYGALVAARRWLYKTGVARCERVGVPVVVVGNVVAGGAGKTPVVMALVRHLQARGLAPGVVSRGYGRTGTACLEVLPHLAAQDCGDEPLLVRQRTGAPVFVAARRVEAARALRRAHPEVNVIVADDGLQHYALDRDINIAVLDDRGLGNGWLLPAGPLREPWRAQAPAPGGPKLGAVDIVLHTGQSPALPGFRSTRRLADHALAADGTRLPLPALQGRRLVALAGIAKPVQFFAMLEEQGLNLERTMALPDHHDFPRLDLLDDAGITVLCTEKDAVKLFARHPDAGERLLAVPLAFSPEPAFFAAVDRLLDQARPAQPHPLPSPHGYTTS